MSPYIEFNHVKEKNVCVSSYHEIVHLIWKETAKKTKRRWKLQTMLKRLSNDACYYGTKGDGIVSEEEKDVH